MKKPLLLGTALLICAIGSAQNNRKSALYNKPVSVKELTKPVSESGFSPANSKPVSSSANNHKGAGICTPVKFASCINAFAVGGGLTTFQQTDLTYNKDLNTVLWTSRVSADWAFTGKTSGAIQTTWLNLAGTTWDSIILYRDSANLHAGRYPSGVLFNPTGNTAVSGGYFAATGPITSNGTPAWVGEFYATRQPSGNYHATNIPNMQNIAAPGGAPFGNVGNSSTNVGFMNIDMAQVGQTVRVSGPMWDYTAPTEAKGGVIAQGTYSGGSFTWKSDSLVPGYLNTAQGLISDGQGGRLAFDPTGNIGYYVLNGRLSTTFNNNADSTMMPIVYKTTDGGNSWNLVLTGYDWTCNHPEILKNVGALLATPGVHTTPNLQHGIDVTVDANGVLHYVTTISMPYQDGRYVGGGFDSLQYTYTYKWDYINNHPIIWDLMTDGSTWKTMLVDSIQTAYMASDPAGNDSTAAFNAWNGTGGVNLSYGAHLTVSRSTDGTKVFYGWGDSDPSSTGSLFNTQPDLWMKAYDVTTSSFAPTSNITNGIGTAFFSYLSDISYYDNTLSSWVVPFVYTVGRFTTGPGVYDGSKAVDFYYGNCSSYNSASFTTPAVINNASTTACLNSVKNNNAFSSAVNNYPNPFNNSTKIVVKLSEAKAINISVADALGKVVYTQKSNGNVGENTFVFDATNLNAGVYFYTVSAGQEKVTKKMIIQK